MNVLLQHLHDLVFAFGDLEIRILTEAVEKNNRVQDFSAHDAVPSEEDVIHVIKLLKDHPAPAPLAADILFLLLVSLRDWIYS